MCGSDVYAISRDRLGCRRRPPPLPSPRQDIRVITIIIIIASRRAYIHIYACTVFVVLPPFISVSRVYDTYTKTGTCTCDTVAATVEYIVYDIIPSDSSSSRVE